MSKHLYTSVEIYNMALARIGCSQFITTFADDSREGKIGKRIYTETLEKVMAEFPWPFLIKYLTLTAYTPPVTTAASPKWHIDWWGSIGETDVNNAPGIFPDNWTYAYQYPSDCLSPRSLWSGLYPTPPASRLPFRVIDSGSGTDTRIILCNEPDAILEYTYIPGGYEDYTRGPEGDGDLTTTITHYDSFLQALFDDLTEVVGG